MQSRGGRVLNWNKNLSKSGMGRGMYRPTPQTNLYSDARLGVNPSINSDHRSFVLRYEEKREEFWPMTSRLPPYAPSALRNPPPQPVGIQQWNNEEGLSFMPVVPEVPTNVLRLTQNTAAGAAASAPTATAVFKETDDNEELERTGAAFEGGGGRDGGDGTKIGGDDNDPLDDDDRGGIQRFRPLFPGSASIGLVKIYAQRNDAARRRDESRLKLKEARTLFEEARRLLRLAEDEDTEREEALRRLTRDAWDAELREPSSWNDNYRRMKEFHQEHGHVDVPYRGNFPEGSEMRQLANFVEKLRRDRKKGSLRDYPHRVEAVEKMGFRWSREDGSRKYSAPWEKRIKALLAYKVKHGHCRIKLHEDRSLYKWLYEVRSDMRNYGCEIEGAKAARDTRGRGPFTPEKFQQIEEILDDDDDLENDSWNIRIEALRAHKEEHGHCRINRKEDPSLYGWVAGVRVDYKHHKEGNTESTPKATRLTPENIALLRDLLGEELDSKFRSFHESLMVLKEHKERKGNCNHPDEKMKKWIQKCRVLYRYTKSGKTDKRYLLSEDKIASLNAFGFCWEACQCETALQWERRMNVLREYKERHGNFRVTRKNDAELAGWVSKMRKDYQRHIKVENAKDTKLTRSGARLEQLHELMGDDLNSKNMSFEERYRQLKEHRELTGNCVPPDKDTRQWITSVKGQYKKWLKNENVNKEVDSSISLTKEKFDMLNNIGLCWGRGCSCPVAVYVHGPPKQSHVIGAYKEDDNSPR